MNRHVFSLIVFLSVIAFFQILKQNSDAIIHSHALNWRMGRMAKIQAVADFPQLPLANLAVSLEPEDYRRGYMMKAAGQAKFYGPKKNNCYQLEYSCRYEPVWQAGPFDFWPEKIKISGCIVVRTEIPY